MSQNRARVPESSKGARDRVEADASAVVVGGGLAGVAAAVVLAERGVKVTLLERESYLGGRAGAWPEKLSSGESLEMERGFHAFFRQYYNLRELLRRIDPELRNLIPLLDYPLLGPDGAMESFSGLPHRAPLNVIELVRRTPRLTIPDLARVNVRAAMEMVTYDPERTYREMDHRTAREYLDSLNFPPDARQMLFDVFAHSFFNPEERMSAGDLLMMFHFYFMGNPEGLIFDVLNEPFSYSLWYPFRRYLEKLGAEIELEQTVTRISRDGGERWQVHVADGEEPHTADVVVLGVEVPALKKLVAASPDLHEPGFRSQIDSLDVTLPFAVWRLWLDKPPHTDRSPFAGTAGLGNLDNISIYELFEGESRRWTMRTGGSVVELHGYAVPEEMSEAEMREDLRANAFACYPELREARVVDEVFLIRRDCPAFFPGSHANRPTVETPIDGLALAGDFVRTPFPSALMERAAATGFMAANHLAARWDARPEPIWSVPPRGLLAGIHRR